MIMTKPWRAAAGAFLALTLSLFIPSFVVGANAAAKVKACKGLTPDSPCELTDSAVNWFWMSNSKVTTCVPPPEGAPSQVPGVCGPVSVTGGVFSNAAGVASPISSGHFGVAMKDGAPDMRGYVKIDTGVIPPGSAIDSFVITLVTSQPNQEHTQEHAANQQHVPATVNDTKADILACAVSEPWGAMSLDGGDPPYSTKVDQDQIDPADPDPNDGVSTVQNEPAYDCGSNATGTRAPDGSTWSFDITSIAQEWFSGKRFNEGIALVPQETGVASTWTVEFHGPALTVTPTEGVVPGTGGTDDVVLVSKKERPTAVVSFAAPDVPAPVIDTGPPPPAPTLPEFPSFTNIPQSAPDVAPPPVQQPTPTVPIAVGANPGFWWWMFPLGALAFGLYASAVGSDAAPAGFAGSGNRVAGVLHTRRLHANGIDEPISAGDAGE